MGERSDASGAQTLIGGEGDMEELRGGGEIEAPVRLISVPNKNG